MISTNNATGNTFSLHLTDCDRASFYMERLEDEKTETSVRAIRSEDIWIAQLIRGSHNLNEGLVVAEVCSSGSLASTLSLLAVKIDQTYPQLNRSWGPPLL